MFGWLRRSYCQNLVVGGGGCRCANSDWWALCRVTARRRNPYAWSPI
ncbi:hypothetical protein RchiOBHm_Chr2g0139551 [Rosa chinensis]|uniref:Uncharacterized protein n=1 Tax=Rosa chinensis TaxID=74649 RepID=A0A2P6RX46_ROSCH|nr:hypothetical protein RchiOBHm_Chr2g0139551 [Rosa chinensis]